MVNDDGAGSSAVVPEELPPLAFPSIGCLELRRIVDVPFSLPPLSPAESADLQEEQHKQHTLDKDRGDGCKLVEATTAAELADASRPDSAPQPSQEGSVSLLSGLLRRLLRPQQQQQQQRDNSFFVDRLGFELPICGVPNAQQICSSWGTAGRVQSERGDKCVSVISWEGRQVFFWLLWPNSSYPRAAAAASVAAKSEATAEPPPGGAGEGAAGLYVYTAEEAVLSCSLVERFSILTVTYDTKPPRTELLLLPQLHAPTPPSSSKSSKKVELTPQPLVPLRRLLLPRDDIVLQWVGDCPWGVLFLCFCLQTKFGALMLLHSEAIATQQKLALQQQQEEGVDGQLVPATSAGDWQSVAPVKLLARDFSSAWLPTTPFPPCAVSVHPSLPVAVVVGFCAQERCAWTCWVPLHAMKMEREGGGESDNSDEEEEGLAVIDATSAAESESRRLRNATGKIAADASPPVVVVLPSLDLLRSLAARHALEAMDAHFQQQQQQNEGEQQQGAARVPMWRSADSPESFYGPVFFKPRELAEETDRWLREKNTSTRRRVQSNTAAAASQEQHHMEAAEAAAQRRQLLLAHLRDRLHAFPEDSQQQEQKQPQLQHVTISSCGGLLALSLSSDELLLLRLTRDEQAGDGSNGGAAYYEPLAFLPAPFMWHVRSRAVVTPELQVTQHSSAATVPLQQRADEHTAQLRNRTHPQKEQQQEQQQMFGAELESLEETVALLQVDRSSPPMSLSASFFAGEASELLVLFFSDQAPLEAQQQQQQQQLLQQQENATTAASLDRESPGNWLCVAFDLDRNSLLMSPQEEQQQRHLQQQRSEGSRSTGSSSGSCWAVVDGCRGPPTFPLAVLHPLGDVQHIGGGGSGGLQQQDDTLLLLSVERAGCHSSSSTGKHHKQQQRGGFRLSLSSLQCGDVVSFAAAAASQGRWGEGEALLQRSLSLARSAHEAAAAAAVGGDEVRRVVLNRSEEEVQRLEEALQQLQQQRWQQVGSEPTASEDDFQAAFRFVERAAAEEDSSTHQWLVQQALMYEPFAATTAAAARYSTPAADTSAVIAGAWTPHPLPLRRLRLLLQRALQLQQQQQKQQQTESDVTSAEAVLAERLQRCDLLLTLSDTAARLSGVERLDPASAAVTITTSTAVRTETEFSRSSLKQRQKERHRQKQQQDPTFDADAAEVSKEVGAMLLQQLRMALAALLKIPCDAETDGEQLPFVLQLAQVFAAHSQTLAVELLLQQHPQQLHPHWRSILSAFPEAIPPQRMLHLLPRQIPTFDSNGYGSARNSSSSVLEATAEDIAAWTVERCLAIMKGPGLLQHCALPLATTVLLLLLRQAPPADLAAAAAAALEEQQQAREALTMSRLDQKQLQQIQQQHELQLQQQKRQQQRAAAAAAEASLSAAVLAAGHTPLASAQAESAPQANSHSPPAAAEAAVASATSTMPAAAAQVEVMDSSWGIDRSLLQQQQHTHSELQNGYRGIRRLCALHGLLRQFLLLQMLQLRCRELQQQQEHPAASSPPTVFRRPPAAGKRLQQELQQKRVLLENATEDFFSFVRLADSSRLLLLLLHLVAAQQQQEPRPRTFATEAEGSNSRTHTFAAAAVATLVEPFAALECFASPEGQTPGAAVAACASDTLPAATAVPITAAQPHEDLTPLLRAVDSCFRRGLLLELSLCLSAEAADPLTAAAALRASRCSAAAAVGAAAEAAEEETGPATSTEEGLTSAATGLTETTALRLLRWVLLLLAAKCSSPQLPPECRLIPDASLLLRLALVAAYRKDSCLPGARVAVYVKAVLREALQQLKQQQQQLGTAWAAALPAAAASAAAEAVAVAAGVPSPPEKELQSDVSLLLHQTEAVVAAQELFPGRGKGPVLRATFLDLRAAAFSEKAAKQLLLPLLEEAIWQQQAACSTGSSRLGEKAGAEWMNMFNRTVYIHRKLSVAMPPTDFYMHLASLLASLPPLQTADAQQQQQHPLLLLLPLWEQAALLAGDNTRKEFAERCCCLLLQRAQSLLDKPPQQMGPHTALAATLLQRAAAVADDALHALQQHLQQLPPQTQQQQQQRQLQRIKTDIEQETTLHSVVVLLYDLLQQQQQQQWALPSALGAASAAAATAAAAAAAAAEAAISRARGAALNALLSSGDTDSEGRGSSDSEGPSSQEALAATATTAGGTATDAALKVAAARATAAEAACVLLQLAQPPVLRQQLRTAFGRRQLLSVLLQKQPQLALQQQQMIKHLGKLLSIEADEQQQLIDTARGFAYRALGERGAATTIAATLLAAELHNSIAATAAGVGPAKEDGKRRESLEEADQTTHKRQRTAAPTQGEQVAPAAARTVQQYAAAAAAAASRLARSTERPLLASLGEAAAADLLQQQAPRLASRIVAAAVCSAAEEQLPGLLRCAAAARSAAAASPAGVSQPHGRPAAWEPATAADLVPPPDASTPGEADNQSIALNPSQASAVWLLNSQNFRPQGSNSNGSGTVQYHMARSVLKLLGSEKPTAAAAVAAAGNTWGPPSFLFVSAFEAAGGAVASAAASAKQFYAAALAADAAADAHIQQQQEQQKHQQNPANTGRAAAEAASARAVASALHEWGVLKEVGESSSRSALIAAAFSPLLGAPKDLLLQPSSWELAGVPVGVVDWQALLRRDVAVAVLLLSSAGDAAPGATAAHCTASATPGAAANAASSEECNSEELLLTSGLPASCAALLQTPGLTAAELLLVVQHLLLLELMPRLLLICPQNPSLERLATALLLLLRFLKRVPHPRHLRISNSSSQDSSKRELPVLLGARLVGDSAYRRDTLLQIGAADSSLIDAAAAAMAAAEPLSAPLKSLQPLVPKKGLSFCSSSSTTVSPLSGTVGAQTGPLQQLQQHRQQQQIQQQQHPAMETDEDASSATPCHLTLDNSVVKSCALVKDPSCLASAESIAATPNEDPQQHQRQEQHRQMQEPPKAAGFQPNAEVLFNGSDSNDATVIESLGGEGLSLRLEHAKKTLLLNATPLNIAMASEASPSVSVLLRCAPAALGLLVLDCMAALLQANKPQTLSLLHPSVLLQLCHRESRREQHSPAAETADSAAAGTTGGGSAAAVATAAASLQYNSFDSVGDCVLPPQEFQRRILFMRRLFACCVSALRCEPALFLLPTVRRAAAEATAAEADGTLTCTESSLLRVARVAVESAGLGVLADEETLGALQLSMPSLDAAALLLPPPSLLQGGGALSGPTDAIQSATAEHVDDPFAVSFAAAADSSNICVALCLRQQMECLARRSSTAALCFSALEKHLQQLKKNFSGLSFPAFDVLENYELRQTATDQCCRRTAGDTAEVSQRTPDAGSSADTSGAASDIVSLLLKQLPLEDWGRLLMHVKPLGPSLQLLIALPMHHQLQQHHQVGPRRDEGQRMHSGADDFSGPADRTELTNKLRQLLDRLVTILPFAASWEQRVGSSPSFFTEDRSVPEAAAELLTTATDEVYKAFSGTFWRLACRHALAHPRHSKEAEAACPRVAVLSDLAALISTGFSAWLRFRWQLMQHQEQQHHLQQEKQEQFKQAGQHELRDVRDVVEATPELVETALDKLLQRTAYVPLKSTCESLAFALFVLQQITRDSAPYKTAACDNIVWEPAELLTHIRLFQVLVGHTRSLRNTLEVLDAEQQASMDSLAANCFKTTSELLQIQERCLDRLAVYALFPDKEDRQVCSTLLNVRMADSGDCKEPDVGKFVLRVIETLNVQGNAFTTSRASVRSRCAALLLWRGERSCGNQSFEDNSSAMSWSPFWSDSVLQLPQETRQDSAPPQTGAQGTTESKAWNALLDTADSIEDKMILRLLSGKHVADNAHLYWEGQQSPLLMLMTWDAQLHVSAVNQLLEKSQISGASNRRSHSGSVCLPGLHSQLDVTDTNVDMLQLAHAFTAACLLLLTGHACALTSTTFFPFIMELLEEDLWEDDTCRDTHTTTATTQEHNASKAAGYWIQSIQRFLLKWWIRGSGELQVSQNQKRGIRDICAENEVSMLQVVQYLSTFVRSLRSVLQRSLVLQLCLNGNLNTAVCAIRKFGNTILPPKGVHKIVEISQYLSLVYPSPICLPQESKNDRYHGGPNGNFYHDISAGSKELSVAFEQSSCKKCRPSCDMFLGFVPGQYRASMQRYLAQRFISTRMPKAYVKDLERFVLRVSTAIGQQLSMAL